MANPISTRIAKGNRFITTLMEGCLSEIVTATGLVKIKQAWKNVPVEERGEWLKTIEDNALADIANLANQFHITRYGEMVSNRRYKAFNPFLSDKAYQVRDYRNAFHHPEDFEAPKLEWDAIIPIRNHIENGLQRAQQVYESRTGKHASDTRRALKTISQMLEEHPVHDPAAFTPETFEDALNTAIQFSEVKAGAYLSACRKIHDQLHLEAAEFDSERSKILPFEFNNSMLQAFTEKRRKNAHTVTGPVPTDIILEKFKNPLVLPHFKNALRRRDATIPEIENSITQFADSLPAPARGGGKPTPPPNDNSVMERHSTFWQDRIAQQNGLGHFPSI